MRRTKRALDEQVIVITGASSGIGLAAARCAAERGAAVLAFAGVGAALLGAARLASRPRTRYLDGIAT